MATRSLHPAAGRYGSAAILVLQPLLFFWNSLIAQTTHIPWDLPGFHTPLVAEVAEAIRQGRFPLWDPYVYAGYPFHADIAVQLFYPPAWPVFALSAFREHAIFYWLEWLVAAHLVLAGAGAYRLLRRLACGRGAALFGATSFQLGCFFASQPQHLGAVAAAAWMPWAWLGVVAMTEAVTPRRIALLAAALAMVFLAGFPALALVAYTTTVLIAAGSACLRRSPRLLVGVAAAFLLAGLLGAVQLLPTLQFTPMTMAAERWRWSEPGGVTPRAIAGAFWPDFLHIFTPYDKARFTEPANFTFLYFYNGQAAAWLLVLALFLRNGAARVFAAIAGLALLFLCGAQLPGYAAFYRALPRFVHRTIYVEFTLVAYSLGAAIAAGLTLERLLRRRPRWTWAVALATGLELLLVASNRPMNSREGGWKHNDSARQVRRSGELLTWMRRQVRETEPPLRIDNNAHNPRFTTGAPLLRLPSANGDNPFAPLRLLAYRGLYSKVIPWERQYPVEKLDSPLPAAANVGFLMYSGAPDDDRMQAWGWSRVPVPDTSDDPFVVYRNRHVLPRYRLVPEVRVVQNQAQALQALAAVDLRRTAVVEGSLAPPTAAGSGAPGEVTVLRYSPERVDLQVVAKQPAYLVVAEGYAPAWEVSLDDVPAARPLPTNVAFMGLPVPPGAHRVSLRYRPHSLYLGAAISVAAGLAALAMVRQRTQPAPSHS